MSSSCSTVLWVPTPAVYPKLFILPFYKFTKPPAATNCFNFLMKFFCFTRFQIFHFFIYISQNVFESPCSVVFFQYLFTKPFCITPVVYIFQYLFTKPRHTKKEIVKNYIFKKLVLYSF